MDRPIRVLHVLGRLDRGGTETLIMNIYRNIDRSKIQFDFLIHTKDECDYSSEIRGLGGKIYSISRYNVKNHFNYKKQWKEFLSNKEYSIIHGHLRTTASIYLNIARKRGIYTIAHSHSTASRGNMSERLIKGILQFRLRYVANYYFACSDEAGRWLFGRKIIQSKRYQILKNAIDLSSYKYDENIRNNLRANIGVYNNFVIGHVGSFTFPKNHKFLLELFKEYLKVNNNAILILVGTGELKEEIKSTSRYLGIEEHLILTGSVSNVNEYMQAMDCFVFPSIFEGLGIALVEAQATGLPCIVSDNIPNEALMTDNVKKLSLNQPSVEWIRQIVDVSDKKINRNLQFKKVQENGYDIKNVSSYLMDFYIKVLNEG
ncbi:glycosyltransferase family 1 protein [Terribacillus sp. 7520-G]|uniref:glycosyltransferase family 1 protein n=1 Tax=Terribacillus sp. 7520-G TaxID=2025389 RepID=UPI000BA69383|nr:glycosyltransferase family 1 protein [Terribacillus sp. 7520-G]PAD40396.1 glycosyl transferase family 1 [Terribacillus sp. 7520-G]